MASKKEVKDELPTELLDRAAKSAKRKAFLRDLPIAILEEGKVVLIDKNNHKTVISDRK
ncbi:hypothetical protein [Leptospira wolffii]|uniref:hypothetical protein n=1 Tax=Leptospira wolffii TaxID=409998 RepID=UPI0013FD1E3B|nr:hypothetical protein [Leptospira wolffii]